MHYIFDFDGTIADSFEYVLDFLSQEAGKGKLAQGEAAKYRGKSMKEIGLDLGIPLWKLPFLYFKGRRVMRAHMDNLPAFDGLPELLKKLSDNDHKLYIISSNSSKNIKRFLIKKDLSQYFWAVWGGAGILGKINLVKRLKRKYKIEGDVWYIGDEVSDVVSAKASGVKSVAVSWGFANRESLSDLKPDYLVDSPKELLDLLL